MEISIKDILARKSNPGLREMNIRHTVAEAVTELTGVTVTPGQVSHTDGRVVMNVPPVMKNALLLRLDELKSRLKRDGIVVGELR